MEKNITIIRKDIISDKNISDFEFAVYLAFAQLCGNQNIAHSILTAQAIGAFLYHKWNIKKNVRTNILEALNALEAFGYVGVEITGELITMQNSSFLYKDKYTILYNGDIEKILWSKDNRAFALLRLYCNILNVTYKGVATTYFSSLGNISKPSRTEYMKFLEDNHLIYCVNIYRGKSYLGAYRHKDIIKQTAYNNKNKDDVIVNRNNIGLVKRYNNFVAHPDKYSAEEIARLRDECEAYNYHSSYDGGFDTSIFLQV